MPVKTEGSLSMPLAGVSPKKPNTHPPNSNIILLSPVCSAHANTDTSFLPLIFTGQNKELHWNLTNRSYHKAHKTAVRIYGGPCSPLAARCKFSLQFWEAKEGEEVHLQLTGIQAPNGTSQCAAQQFDLRPQTLRDKVCL